MDETTALKHLAKYLYYLMKQDVPPEDMVQRLKADSKKIAEDDELLRYPIDNK